jgi:hypothetical protein
MSEPGRGCPGDEISEMVGTSRQWLPPYFIDFTTVLVARRMVWIRPSMRATSVKSGRPNPLCRVDVGREGDGTVECPFGTIS